MGINIGVKGGFLKDGHRFYFILIRFCTSVGFSIMYSRYSKSLRSHIAQIKCRIYIFFSQNFFLQRRGVIPKHISRIIGFNCDFLAGLFDAIMNITFFVMFDMFRRHGFAILQYLNH